MFKNEIFNINLDKLYQQGKTIFPAKKNVYKALIDHPRVVILGQDPYHNDNQATGLAFAVPIGVKQPPSLKNIFKELKDDLKIINTDSTLESWKNQGVLLLNTALTVEKNKPNSHHLIWKEVITNYITYLGQDLNLVWVLWGKQAQSFRNYIRGPIIFGPHPSPLSAYRGFFGSKPFSQINKLITGPKIKF